MIARIEKLKLFNPSERPTNHLAIENIYLNARSLNQKQTKS